MYSSKTDTPFKVALSELFGPALDILSDWVGVIDSANRLVAYNRAMARALSDAGTLGSDRPSPFPCWERHAGPVTAFTCPCPDLERLPADSGALCRIKPARSPSCIVSQELLEVGKPTGYRLVVCRSVEKRGDRKDAVTQQLGEILRIAERALADAETGRARIGHDPGSDTRRPQCLSTREWEVVQGLMSHKPLANVADALDISIHTARNHLKSVFRKMRVHSQSELIQTLLEQRNGLNHRYP